MTTKKGDRHRSSIKHQDTHPDVVYLNIEVKGEGGRETKVVEIAKTELFDTLDGLADSEAVKIKEKLQRAFIEQSPIRFLENYFNDNKENIKNWISYFQNTWRHFPGKSDRMQQKRLAKKHNSNEIRKLIKISQDTDIILEQALPLTLEQETITDINILKERIATMDNEDITKEFYRVYFLLIKSGHSHKEITQ